MFVSSLIFTILLFNMNTARAINADCFTPGSQAVAASIKSFYANRLPPEDANGIKVFIDKVSSGGTTNGPVAKSLPSQYEEKKYDSVYFSGRVESNRHSTLAHFKVEARIVEGTCDNLLRTILLQFMPADEGIKKITPGPGFALMPQQKTIYSQAQIEDILRRDEGFLGEKFLPIPTPNQQPPEPTQNIEIAI